MSALNLDPTQRKAIADLLKSSADLGYLYPWDGLEDIVHSGRISKLDLVGYGSLLNPESARRTIRDTPPDGHPPIVAFGAKRIFNYKMPDAVVQRYGIEAGPKERAALNAEQTGNTEDLVNGRLLSVDVDDFDALREREGGYDLLPVAYLSWHDLNAAPKIGFILCARPDSELGAKYVDNTLLPYPPYLDVCREGARAVSKEFEQMFLESTNLGDCNIRLIDYISK